MSGLTGMKEICRYMSRSESTVLGLIRDCDLPAFKIGGGIWESDTDLIDGWRKGQILDGLSSKKEYKKSVKTSKSPQKPRTSKKGKKP